MRKPTLLGSYSLLSAVLAPKRSELDAKIRLWNEGVSQVESEEELVEVVLHEVQRRRGDILFPRGAPSDLSERMVAAVSLVRSLGPSDADLLRTELDAHRSRQLFNRALAIVVHILGTPNCVNHGSRKGTIAVRS